MAENQKKPTLDYSIAFRLVASDFHQLVADATANGQKPAEYARQWLLTRRETLAEIVNLQNRNKVLLVGQTETQRQFGFFRRATYGVLATLILIGVVILTTLVLLPDYQSKNEAVFRGKGVRP